MYAEEKEEEEFFNAQLYSGTNKRMLNGGDMFYLTLMKTASPKYMLHSMMKLTF